VPCGAGVAALDRGADRLSCSGNLRRDRQCVSDSSARALHEVVKVDLRITACPIEKDPSSIAAIGGLRTAILPVYPERTRLCTECRKCATNNCLLIERGEVCAARSPWPAAVRAAAGTRASRASAAAGRSTTPNANSMLEMLEKEGPSGPQVEDNTAHLRAHRSRP